MQKCIIYVCECEGRAFFRANDERNIFEYEQAHRYCYMTDPISGCSVYNNII